jgi:ATP-dependent metalloprotease
LYRDICILTSLCLFLLDLANLVNIAAIKAAVEGADKLNAVQLEFAKDRIIMGTERRSMFISDESRKACLFLLTYLFGK